VPKGRWLLLLDRTNYTLKDLFVDFNIPFDCEFFVAQKEEEEEEDFVFTDVYRVSSSLPLRTHRFNSLSHLTRGFIKRRRDLQGLVLRSGIINSVSSRTAVNTLTEILLDFYNLRYHFL
jgi:hypothetical protein